MSVTRSLKQLRTRAGLSMPALAKAAGFRTASGYQRYEDPQAFRRAYLPMDLTEKLAAALVGRGDPPITSREVAQLAGVDSFERLARGGLAETAEAFKHADIPATDRSRWVAVTAAVLRAVEAAQMALSWDQYADLCGMIYWQVVDHEPDADAERAAAMARRLIATYVAGHKGR